MKKAFQNKFVIAGVIIVVAGGIVYLTTWGNKKWLIDQINEKGGAAPAADGTVPTFTNMTVGQLQAKLRSLG